MRSVIVLIKLLCMYVHEMKTEYCQKITGACSSFQGRRHLPTLDKISVGIAHPGNFSRGLKTSWQ